jgi:hypothetical protein
VNSSQQSPVQEATSVVTIASFLIALVCYVAAVKNVPVISPVLFLLASGVYQWIPQLARLSGSQVPMLVSSSVVGGTIWIIGMAFTGPLASWFSAGELGRLERQTLRLKKNRTRIEKHRRDRDSFDVN